MLHRIQYSGEVEGGFIMSKRSPISLHWSSTGDVRAFHEAVTDDQAHETLAHAVQVDAVEIVDAAYRPSAR